MEYQHSMASEIDKIVELFNTLKPDMVALQEIRQYEGQSQLQQLKALLPDYPHSTYLEVLKGLSIGIEEGIAILSRYPIISTSYIELSSSDSKAAQTKGSA